MASLTYKYKYNIVLGYFRPEADAPLPNFEGGLREWGYGGGGGRTDNLLSTKSKTWHMMRMTRVSTVVSCGAKIYNMVETENAKFIYKLNVLSYGIVYLSLEMKFTLYSSRLTGSGGNRDGLVCVVCTNIYL